MVTCPSNWVMQVFKQLLALLCYLLTLQLSFEMFHARSVMKLFQDKGSHVAVVVVVVTWSY